MQTTGDRLTVEYLRSHWEETGLMNSGQHGFRPGYSSNNQLAIDNVDDGGRIAAVVINFSKAFHVVPHFILLAKFKKSGVYIPIVRWITEFLEIANKVRVNEEKIHFETNKVLCIPI